MNLCNRITRTLATLIILSSTTTFAVQPLEISDVFVQEVDPHDLLLTRHDHLTVLGKNFMNGGVIELWLGDFDLEILSQLDTVITAEMPIVIGAGSYQLVAMSGGGTVRHDDFDGVTIGMQGPIGDQGIQGEQGIPGADGAAGPIGPAGPQGLKGEQGVKGDTGSSGLKGEQGLKGNPGANGLNGAPGSAGQACWDLNGNGGPDMLSATNPTSEDVNGDGIVDARDCKGEQGPQGPRGDPGVSGVSVLANLLCPVDQFVVGFDNQGLIICSSGSPQIVGPFLFDFARVDNNIAQLTSAIGRDLIIFPLCQNAIAGVISDPALVDPVCREVTDFLASVVMPNWGLYVLSGNGLPGASIAIHTNSNCEGLEWRQEAIDNYLGFFEIALQGINFFERPVSIELSSSFLPDLIDVIQGFTRSLFPDSFGVLQVVDANGQFHLLVNMGLEPLQTGEISVTQTVAEKGTSACSNSTPPFATSSVL
jgi:hypothetical protein